MKCVAITLAVVLLILGIVYIKNHMPLSHTNNVPAGATTIDFEGKKIETYTTNDGRTAFFYALPLRNLGFVEISEPFDVQASAKTVSKEYGGALAITNPVFKALGPDVRFSFSYSDPTGITATLPSSQVSPEKTQTLLRALTDARWNSL